MAISNQLGDRSQQTCELCTSHPATTAYTVSPREGDRVEDQVAVCDTCLQAISRQETGDYWRFLEGSIWNPEPAVQALSYRLLLLNQESDWAAAVISSVELEENIVQWAQSAFEVAEVHRDAFGNELRSGDNVVLTQALDVKGTSFSAPKGTVVKKIRLVADNTGQIEGKINDQTIVILTKYVKKG